MTIVFTCRGFFRRALFCAASIALLAGGTGDLPAQSGPDAAETEPTPRPASLVKTLIGNAGGGANATFSGMAAVDDESEGDAGLEGGNSQTEPQNFMTVTGSPALRAQLSRPALPPPDEMFRAPTEEKQPQTPEENPADSAMQTSGETENVLASAPDAEVVSGQPTSREEARKSVNVNLAEADKLANALNLDARRARLIVQFREIYGPMTSPEDLGQVIGINDDRILQWESEGLLAFE